MPQPETLGTERIFQGKVFSVERDRVRLPNGREVAMDLVRHPRSVVLLPIPETKQLAARIQERVRR